MTYEERIEVLKETAMHKDIIIFPEIRAVFAYLCSAATDYHDAANVNSVKIISHFTGLTKYRARKAIKVLRDLGLVERTTCGFPAYEWSTESGTDYEEPHPPVNGFGLTKKGFESATYKKADELNEAEYKRWAEMSEEEILKEMEGGKNERNQIESLPHMWKNSQSQKGLRIRSKLVWGVVYNPVQAVF